MKPKFIFTALFFLSVFPIRKNALFTYKKGKNYLKNRPLRIKIIIPFILSSVFLSLILAFSLYFFSTGSIPIRQFYSFILIVFIGVGALLYFFYHYFRILITDPINKLAKAATEIGKGNFDVDLSLSGDDEIGKLAKDIERMTKSLKRKVEYQKKLLQKNKEVQRKKDEFLGIASHELRTPLTSIKAYVQLLEKSVKDTGDIRTQELIKRADAYLNKLNSLIIGLLDTSRVQAGKLKLEKSEFDFDEMIKESVKGARFFTSKHKLKIEGEANSKVYADKMRIEQVYFNLISNAIKYSPDSKEIVVGVKKNRSFVYSYIKDFGIGIPEKETAKIFDRFYRLENPEKFSGLGLGLYISNQIIRRHGGKMWVKSKKNLGSTFYFSIPLRGN